MYATRRRHPRSREMIISEITRASNFKIYRHIALNSLYISTENHAIIYFWSAANRMCSFLVVFVSRFLDNASTDFEKVYNFGTGDSSDSFSAFKTLDIFLLIDPENGVQMDLPSSTHYINGSFHIVAAFNSHMRKDA